MPGVERLSARQPTQHGLRSIVLAAAFQAMACSPGAAQTTSPLPGVLRGWFKLPHGVDLDQLQISAPGFVMGWKALSSVVRPTPFPDWHQLVMKGKVPWSGNMSLHLSFDYGGFGGYETHHVWSSDATRLDSERELGLIDLSSAFVVRRFRLVDVFGKPIKGAALFEVGRLPTWDTGETSSWGWRGTTDAKGVIDAVWLNESNGCEVHADDGYIPARFPAPLGATFTLRRGFPLCVHVPPSVLPKYPFCLEAVAWIRGQDAVTPEGVIARWYQKAIFDDSGTAELFVPLKGDYEVMISVEIEKSFFCDPRSGAGVRLELPAMTARIVSEAAVDIDAQPGPHEIARLSRRLAQENKHLWDRTALPTSRPARAATETRSDAR